MTRLWGTGYTLSPRERTAFSIPSTAGNFLSTAPTIRPYAALDCLRLAAVSSEDGVVEAVEWPNLGVYGVQWHPERMSFALRREDTVDGQAVFSVFSGNLLVNFCPNRISRLDNPSFECYNIQRWLCASAGTGRQARLRCVCLRRTGSSPVSRTTSSTLMGTRFFIPLAGYPHQAKSGLFPGNPGFKPF